MAGIVRGRLRVTGKRDDFPFGPFIFDIAGQHDEFVAAEIEISATSTLQLIGGVSPTIADITTVQFLLLKANQAMKVGIDGVTASSAGYTMNANKPEIKTGCSLTQVQLYNSASATARLLVIIGGT